MSETNLYHHTIGSKLAIINRYDGEFFRDALRQWGLGTHDMAVLMQLDYFGELYQDEIVANTHMNRTTLSKTIAKLVDKGLAYTTRSSDDKRIVYVGLTNAGKAIMPSITDTARTWIDDLVRGFSESEREQLEGFIDRMLANARMRDNTRS